MDREDFTNRNSGGRSGSFMKFPVIGGAVVAVLLLLGTIWLERSAQRATENAVHSVSLLYLDELAGRREQVVANNIETNINNMYIAISLMTEEDLSDLQHFQAFQGRMKQLYGLEKFAFVDTEGRIYTSLGMQDNIDEYDFDFHSISGPEVSIKNLESNEKKVIIAVPADNIRFEDETLVVCFVEIDMTRMLQGVSLTSDDDGTTFCNIYTRDGIALTNVVLGGLAQEDNLLEALKHAEYMEDSSW